MIRRVIACCRPHGFLGTPGALMQGTEVIMVAAETESEVNEKLGDLLYRFGWTKREDERWECGKHGERPDMAINRLAQARSRICDRDKFCHHETAPTEVLP